MKKWPLLALLGIVLVLVLGIFVLRDAYGPTPTRFQVWKVPDPSETGKANAAEIDADHLEANAPLFWEQLEEARLEGEAKTTHRAVWVEAFDYMEANFGSDRVGLVHYKGEYYAYATAVS
jgi:hypothetical protein